MTTPATHPPIVKRLEEFQEYYKLNARCADLMLWIGRGVPLVDAAKEMHCEYSVARELCRTIEERIGASSADTKKVGQQVFTGRRYVPPGQSIPDEAECKVCHLLRPIEKLPYWPGDKICAACREDMHTMQLAEKRKLKIKDTLQAVLKETSKPAVKLPSVTLLLADVADEFGGVEGVASEWARHIRLAADNNPGKKFVLDHFLAFTKLLLQSHVAGGDMSDMDAMDDAELREYLCQLVLSQMASGTGSQQTLLRLLVDENLPNDDTATETVEEDSDGKACA